MIEASNAPAVPGAKGEKPEPKPVPIKTGRNYESVVSRVPQRMGNLYNKKVKVEVEHPPVFIGW